MVCRTSFDALMPGYLHYQAVSSHFISNFWVH